MTTLYGIKNCDTVKKARRWLDENSVQYQFHDFRELGVNRQQVSNWVEQLGWEIVINKRSTSWKQLDKSTRESMNSENAIGAILDNPTLVKRPLLDKDGEFSVGFSPADYSSKF